MENNIEKLERFIVDSSSEDERIDKYLSECMENLSRSYLQKLVKGGQVNVNGKPVKSNYRLKENDKIELLIPKAIEPEILPEDLKLDIVYEDNDFLIVNKPKGMVVHPAPGHFSGTLVNGLMYHCKDSLSGINGVLRPGIVHRIDMNTTGLLVVCKNDIAHNDIAEQLKVHSITRTYHAIVHGRMKELEGTIDAPIGRHPNNRLKMAINEKNGKNAVTHYKVLDTFKDYTYIECRLETGRTHQIRVHMSSIHHPLLGDTIYGGKEMSGVVGQVLHAKTLGFIHPTTKEYVEFNSELPEYFKNLLKKLPR